jgi:hypothetical protein
MKYATCFLAGAIFSATAGVLAGGRFANFLLLGAGLALTSLGAVVYLIGLRRVARFLNAFMDALEGAGQPDTRPAKQTAPRASRIIDRSNPMGYVKPSKKQEEQILRDTAAEYLEDDELFGTARRVQ